MPCLDVLRFGGMSIRVVCALDTGHGSSGQTCQGRYGIGVESSSKVIS